MPSLMPAGEDGGIGGVLKGTTSGQLCLDISRRTSYIGNWSEWQMERVICVVWEIEDYFASSV